MNNKVQSPYLNLDYFFYKIYQFFQSLFKIKDIDFSNVKTISFFVVIFFATGIVLLLFRLSLLGKRKVSTMADFFAKEGIPEERTLKWKSIKDRIDSDNLADWKSAIIEADNLVNQIIGRIGYEGETLEEKLKIIEPSDFDNLKNVWEAHQLRKKIDKKFEGIAFEIKKEDAKSAIGKYEKALKELKYL